MNVLVTGASGHLGANLVRSLISSGYEVQALVHRETRALEGLEIQQVRGNILDPDSIKTLFRGIDTVFHLAARISIVNSDRNLVEEMNITGVRNVVDACLSSGVNRLVHVSSFHSRVQEPLDETFDETRTLVKGIDTPPYNRSKAEGERIIASAVSRGLNAVIIIPTGIIGPNDFQPSLFGETLVNIALKKLRILVDAGLDWVDARDVAMGMIAAAEKANAGTSFLLSGHRASLREIAEYIGEYMSIKPPKIILPLNVATFFAPVVSSFSSIRGKRRLFTRISMDELNSNRDLSHQKATAELGYNPRPLKETIFDTLEWFKSNGYLGVQKR
ncbi:MAG: NAD-dependent epimerase/dehydratase family protein [Dehalococcoidales bacterium]|nr:NAD-dependent epimerase/dehydratase family protein [Dehalococcoidales bacterium]